MGRGAIGVVWGGSDFCPKGIRTTATTTTTTTGNSGKFASGLGWDDAIQGKQRLSSISVRLLLLICFSEHAQRSD